MSDEKPYSMAYCNWPTVSWHVHGPDYRLSDSATEDDAEARVNELNDAYAAGAASRDDELAKLRANSAALDAIRDHLGLAADVEPGEVVERVGRLRETIRDREAELLRCRTHETAAAHELDAQQTPEQRANCKQAFDRIAELEDHRDALYKLNESDYLKLRDWLADPDRKPAADTFTAGVGRDAAMAVEESGVLGDGWISVEDGPPKIDQPGRRGLLFNVIVDLGGGYRDVTAKSYIKGEGWNTTYQVVAWQPLPPLPKGVEDAE